MKLLVSRMLVAVLFIFVINFIVLFLSIDKRKRSNISDYLLNMKGYLSNDYVENSTTQRYDNAKIEVSAVKPTVGIAESRSKLFTDQKCKIPELNPFHPDVIPHLRESTVKPCAIKKYGELQHGILHLKLKNVQKVWLFYIHRVDDFNIRLSKGYSLFGGDASDSNTGNLTHNTVDI